MPKPHPLTPDEARRTLAHRIGSKLAPKVRQLATKFGVRPVRVFLVWVKWTGAERGEGRQVEVRREELLPTPRVDSLDAVTFSLLQAGTVPVGSVKVSQISVSYTSDFLRGRSVPVEHEEHLPEPYDFFYELIEDGRGDDPAARQKYRLLNQPFRRAGKVDWTLMLEREGQDSNRDGTPATGAGTEG